MRLLYLFVPLFLSVALISCSTSSDYNRGSLSDAMEKTKDDSEEDREVPSEIKDDRDSDQEHEERRNQGDEDINYEGLDASELMFSIRGGTNFYSDPYFDSDMEGEVLLGVPAGEGSFRFYLFGGVKILQAQSDDPIALSIKKDAIQLNGGVEFRYYPLPELPVFSPYLIGRCGGFFLFWNYKNDLIWGDDTISSDIIGGVLLGTGIGVDLIHLKAFSLGAQLIPEVYLFGEETSEGFTNDYFDSYGTIRFTVEAGFSL
jgi:hypothetical protein